MGRVITDAELVAASRRGEREAFGQIVERYLGLVCAVTYSSTRDQALSEDVAQETFLAAWGQLDQLRETSRVRAWLCGIARNLARKARRRVREEPREGIDEAHVTAWAALPTATPFEAASQAERERLVWAALENVPEAYREVLVLYYQQQRSVKEVAGALGISEDAALQRLGRGRKHLQGQVTDLVEEALAGSRPRRGLAAAIVAGLPPMGGALGGASGGSIVKSSGSSSLHVATHTAGARMLKIAFVLFAGAGVAGATYVATSDREDATRPQEAAVAAPSPRAAAAVPDRLEPPALAASTPPKVRAPGVEPGPGAAEPAEECEPPPGDDDGACEGAVDVTARDDEALTAEQIAKTGLYDGPAKGPADALVEIAIFQDLECQFCAKVLGTIDQLWDEYPGQLRLVVKQMPLPGHRHAQLASEATLAAQAQGRFWEFHDLALAYQDDLTRASLVELAGKAGLDVAAFTRALDERTYAPQVARDVASAQELDITGTPTFFINGKRFTGARPIEDFRGAIDAAIAARRAK